MSKKIKKLETLLENAYARIVRLENKLYPQEKELGSDFLVYLKDGTVKSGYILTTGRIFSREKREKIDTTFGSISSFIYAHEEIKLEDITCIQK